MKSTRVLVVFFGILLSIGLLGCGGGGGGGGGGTVAPDAPAITARLNSFVKAMAHGNAVEATKFMSSRLAAASGGGTLIIKDFGDDIDDPSDDKSYNFLIPSDGILQSGDIATVRAEYTTDQSVTLSITFTLLREEGEWYIDDVEVTSSSTTTYRLADWFQVNPGNTWTYKIKYGGGLDSTYKVRYTVEPSTLSQTYTDTPTSTSNTVEAYSMKAEALDASGNPITPISSVAGTARGDDPEPRLSWNSSFEPETFSGDNGTLYFGVTGREVSADPWQMIPEEVTLGTSYTPSTSFNAPNGSPHTPRTDI
ncbi:MAG TPA: hypothetical protein PKO06_03400, partial [Candidatus Ozemobacteraceae bacterium]|nr:hypothetical protein [Candidatus Ozemobacteraceae bacterium]